MSFVGNLLGSAIGLKSNVTPSTSSPFGTANPAAALDDARTRNNLSLIQQQAFVNQLNPYASQGLQNQSDIYGQQQALASQLQQQSMGQGPNPAQSQLAQNTGNIAAQQAALMAGQRGASANAGLLARQAGLQGGSLMQQSAGQAATLQAQQQLAAQQALMQQQQAMAGLAGQQVGQYGSNLNAYQNNALGTQQSAYGAVTNQNQANIGAANAANQANIGRAGDISGLIGAVGGAAAGGAKLFGSTGSSNGGGTQWAAHGGVIGNDPSQLNATYVRPDKGYGKVIIVGLDQKNDNSVPKTAYANGGCVSNVGRMLMSGGPVPGQAKVAGDSLQNDTVSAKLSPGEIVIPRSIAQHPDAPNKAAQFVAALLAKKGR